MVQKVCAICEAKTGTETDELLQTRTLGKMLKRIQALEEGRVPAKEATNWRIDGEKKKNYEKGVSEAGKQV